MMKQLLLAVALMLACVGSTFADDITIDVTLEQPDGNVYQLAGQSAFIQYRTFSGTTGGQLDGVDSFASPWSFTFTEAFPEPTLSDYLTFAYFGIIHRLTIDQYVGDEVGTLDTSLIVAFQPGVADGLTINDIFLGLGYTEADLVAAMTGSFDSTEFFALMSEIDNSGSAQGAFGIPPLAQVGDTLDLIAFIGGANGDQGVKVGELQVSVVPEPASIALIGLGSLALLRRRRAA